MRCSPFASRTRICQAAHYAEDLVEESFHLEMSAGLMTQHKYSVSPFRTGEETITESMLVRLQGMFSDVILVETYNKQTVEPKYGADWFWILDFGHKLVPMLVQAKRTREPWDGDWNWDVDVDAAQKTTIETTAKKWNVGCHYCIYAPTWDHMSRCFPGFRHSFMHILPTTCVSGNGFASADWNTVQHMVPFTCFCCCATDPGDATDLLRISPEKFADSDNLERLVTRARADEHVKGTVVLRVGGEQIAR